MDKSNKVLVFENVWGKHVFEQQEIKTIWKQFNPGLDDDQVEERLQQIVWLVKNEFHQVVALSTAYPAFIKQLKLYMYAVRLMIVPGYRIPGLMSKILVDTRDFLEANRPEPEESEPQGIITLVENEKLKKLRNEAVWPASRMVYIGNSKKGHRIYVYYFKGALID